MRLAEGQLTLDLFPVDGSAPEPRPAEPRDPDSPQSQVPRAIEAEDATPVAVSGSALLTTREAAEVLHVHPRTVQRLVERGELSVIRLGSAVRFDPFDLGGLISGLKRRTTSSETQVADSVRARNGATVSFADRLRSQQHEHRAAHA
jgi:excisionase family DNA binding protein